MAKPTSIFKIADLRGGINNQDSPTLLADNEVVDARNVDFSDGALGAKRKGTEGISLSSATFDSPVIAIFRHTPTNLLANDEIWGIDENGNLDRRVGGTWQGGVARVNNHVTIKNNNFDANAASLHGKLFIAAQGDYDRLLVWDGTVLRWAGIQQPPVPTVGNTGAGTFASTRYYRIRYTQQVSGVTVRRSEPSDVVTFTPSGAGSGALITKPAGTEAVTSLYCEGQTHWEVEASVDNILFYRIATTVIGTATYTDSTAYATGYSSNPLSEAIGEYVVPGAPRHVTVDEDRILIAGSYFTPADDATVWWTPVGADDGVGNDERLPQATLQYITFDGLDGGRVTAIAAGVTGTVYVFKNTRIYKMMRTGVLASAYEPSVESFSRGCTMRGATIGTDYNGITCAYFLDPAVGLCRIGPRGIENLARKIDSTWQERNLNALIGPRILHYPTLDQVWFTFPSGLGEAIQTNTAENIQTDTNENILTSVTTPILLVEYETRFSSLMFHDGLLGSAQALALVTKDDRLVPAIGTDVVSISGGGTSSIHFADTGTTDSGTTFRAYVKTKPYTLGDLWTKFKLMAGVLLARASSANILVKMIRNFGVETRNITVPINSSASHVIKPMDNAYMSELNTVQVEYGDSAASSQAWSMDQLVFKITSEEGSAG